MKRETRKKTNDAAVFPKAHDSSGAIASRAYDIWLNEGGSHGRDLEHWLQAERELAGEPRQETGTRLESHSNHRVQPRVENTLQGLKGSR